jgi:putative nucleotidyltransferase with HDIG domain
MGIALLGTLRLPASGRLGLNNLWRHAVYSASCCEQLARQVPAALHVKPGLAYLAGLLQDIGYVLLAHSFNKELFWLHKAITFHPQIPVIDIERHVLGLTHMEVGCELLRNWRLPEEVVVGVQHHHDEHGAEAHARYAQLVLLANRALARHGMGEETDDTLPPHIVQALGLTDGAVVKVAERMLDAHADLDHLAQQLAA